MDALNSRIACDPIPQGLEVIDASTASPNSPRIELLKPLEYFGRKIAAVYFRDICGEDFEALKNEISVGAVGTAHLVITCRLSGLSLEALRRMHGEDYARVETAALDFFERGGKPCPPTGEAASP